MTSVKNHAPQASLVIQTTGLMGSVVQFAVWFWLLRRGDPVKVSVFLFLAPFFGVLSDWLLLREPITEQVVWGGPLIFAGVYWVNRVPARS